MRELVEFVARELASQPDQVRIKETSGAHHTVIYLKVAPEDMGRIIGKSGRIAGAMRALLRVAAIRQGRRVSLEIR